MMSPNVTGVGADLLKNKDSYSSGSNKTRENDSSDNKFDRRNIKRKSFSIEYKIALMLVVFNLLFKSGSGYSYRSQLSLSKANPHHCYVCLPDDKNSNTARDIQQLFPETKIQDCSSFDPHSENAQDELLYKLSCPMGYSGCLLRSAGNETARTCTPFKKDECITVNSIELCYCPHSGCNREKSTLKLGIIVAEERRTSRHHVHQDLTDDEDLLPTNHQGHTYLSEQDDDHDDGVVEGSGLGILDSSSRDQSNYNQSTPVKHEEHNPSTSHEDESEDDIDSSENELREINDIQDQDHEEVPQSSSSEHKHIEKMSDGESRSYIPTTESKSSIATNNLISNNFSFLVPIFVSLVTLVNYHHL